MPIKFRDIFAICLSFPIAEATLSNPTNTTNMSMNDIPLATSAGSNFATSLIMPIISNIDTDTDSNIPPSLAVPFLPDLVTNANTATNPANPIIKVIPLPI